MNTKNNTYIPQVADTSKVELPEDLVKLTELMARNVHEEWAQTRIQQGWTYGQTRNDTLKRHPCLIPYDELQDSEREYDKNTAIETVKLIISLGYKIEKVK